jgi:hypothetical protein
VGTALIIFCGRTANPVSGVLGGQPLRGVGLLSYSLYLWHFPLMVFARHLLVRPFTALEIVCLVAATFILSGLSWRYVEQPFRARPRRIERRRLFQFAAGVMVAAVGFGLFTDLSDGAPGRFGDSARALLAAREDRDTSCLRGGRNCELGDPGEPPAYIVWGDSHAGAILPAFRMLSEVHSVSGRALLRGGCIPSIGYFSTTAVIAQSCFDANRAALEAALAPQVEAVFLAGRWTMMVEQSMFGFEGGRAHGMIDETGELADVPVWRILAKTLGQTLDALRAGGKEVFLIGPVPEAGWHVPHTLAQRERFGDLLEDGDIAPSREAFDERNRRTIELLESLASTHDARVLYPHEILCATGRCVIIQDGRPLYYDTDHLTMTGALRLTGMLEPAFEEMTR